MKKVYIIGSLSRSRTINSIAEAIRLDDGFEVDYVRHQPTKKREYLVSEAFTKIEHADIVVAVRKLNGCLGDGTLYEAEYARRCGKSLVVTSGKDFPGLIRLLRA